MKRILLASGMLLCMSAPSWAVCAVTNLTVKDAAGAPVTVLAPYADDGSGGSNCSPQIQIKQGGNVAGVTAGSALKTDASATTQPVSGTVTVNQGTAGAAWPISGTITANQGGAWTATVTQPTAANLNATVTGTVATTQSGAWTVNPTTIGTWGLQVSTQNQAAPTNAALVSGEFNTSPTTITSGNVSPLQLDSSGNLLVNIKAGAAAGGTSSSYGSAFPATGTAIGLSTTAPSSGNMISWAASSNYGTAPSAIAVPAVNAFVTNATALGRNTSANSSPVVPSASPTTWHLVSAASTNATSVKASAATVFGCQLGGVGATPAFLKIYNKASSPTVGTDVPVKTLIIPAASTAANGAGSNIVFGPGGMALSTGFAAAITGVMTDADTTAVAASTFVVNCDYE